MKKLHSQVMLWAVVLYCCLPLGFSTLGLGLWGGSLSRNLLLWTVFMLIFIWRSSSQGLNLSSPPSVSDSPSQLEAFWTLSLISLGRLEHLLLFVFCIGFNAYKKSWWCKEYKEIFSAFLLASAFFFFLFLFSSTSCFFHLAVCWPLTFPSSLSESPLLGHQSSDAARWKYYPS